MTPCAQWGGAWVHAQSVHRSTEHRSVLASSLANSVLMRLFDALFALCRLASSAEQIGVSIGGLEPIE